jgi:endonuclease/exonuclease/phosphatase (EEP) superfamily protein YafD
MFKKITVYVLFFLWLLVLFNETWIWGAVQKLFLPDHPVVQVIASLLQDTLWLPLGLALPAYCFLLFRQRYAKLGPRLIAAAVSLALLLWAVLDPLSYFRYLFILLPIYFLLLISRIRSTQSIRANHLAYTLCLLGLVLHYWPQLWPPLLPRSKATLTLLDYNIRVNQNIQDREKVLQLIDRLQPDLVFVQEISSRDKSLFSDRYRTIYPHQLWSDRSENYNGGAILSRFPFTSAKNIDVYTRFSKGHFNLNHAVIRFNGRNIHLFNGHLFPSGHAFIELLAGQRSVASFLRDTHMTYDRRVQEAELLAQRLEQIHEPIIMAGDLNDTPNSLTYRLFNTRLQNAFRKAGWGLGTTYGAYSLKHSLSPLASRLAFDFLRIDQVFVSNSFKVRSADVLPLDVSDHRPQFITLVGP